MKEFLKKNWISSLIFLILISILFMNEYKYLKNTNKLENSNREAIEKCNKDEIPENMITFCEEVKKLPNLRPEFYSMFYNTYSQGFNFMIFIIFILVIIQPTKNICYFLKNNVIKNTLTRQKYKKTIVKLFLEAYKPALLLPILTIIAIITCYILTGNIDFNNAIKGHTVSWTLSSMKNPILFSIVYILRIFMISLIYINISLIVCKKNHNFIIATILSYLSFIAIEILLEVIFNTLIFKILLLSDSLILLPQFIFLYSNFTKINIKINIKIKNAINHFSSLNNINSLK